MSALSCTWVRDNLKHFVFLFILLAFGATSTARGGVGVWTPSGPPEAVSAVAVSPSMDRHAYEITSSSLYQSLDMGESWIRVGSASPCSPIQTLLLDDVYEDLLYAAGNGVCRSKFGSFEWIRATGLPDTASEMRTVLAGRGVVLAVGRDQGLFWSYDFGETFLEISTPYREPLSVAADPNAITHLYVGTAAGQIFGSDNFGSTWTSTGAGLPGAVEDLVALQPSAYSQTPTLLARVSAHGSYRSLDGGRTWTSFPEGLPLVDIFSVKVDPMFENILYAGTSAGIYRSVTEGKDWLSFSDGFPSGMAVREVLTDPTGRLLIAMPTEGQGVFAYRVPDPKLTASGPSETLITGRLSTVTLTLDPPQPEPFFPTVTSSDYSVVYAAGSGPLFAPLADSGVFSIRPVGAGSATVTMSLPAVFGGASASVRVDVINSPPPEIAGVYPANATAQALPFTLQIFPEGALNNPYIVPTTAVYWNGAPRETRLTGVCTVLCGSQLEIGVTAADLAAGGTVQLTLVNPPPGGGTSKPFSFLVRSPDRAPLQHGVRPALPRVRSPRS